MRKNDLLIKEAELRNLSDIKRAEADAAYNIQQEEQRRTIEIKSADANIARQEKEIISIVVAVTVLGLATNSSV